MNIVNKLTLRQLKLNKKRTLVTIIGTIISAAMITAVATLGLSFMDIMQRDSIANNGNWHVKYSQVNKEQLESIEKNNGVKTVILSSEPGYAYLEGSKNNNKPYLYIEYFNKEGFENFPIELKEGRLPERPDELVISDAVLNNAGVNYKIGDTVDLAIGQRYSTAVNTVIDEPMLQNYSLQWEEDKVAEKLTRDRGQSYKIVGIIKSPNWEYAWAPGYTVISYMDENTLSKGETFDVSVIFKKINSSILKIGDKIIADNGITKAEYNNDLLRYYGIYRDDSVRNMIYTLTAIILAIIMIGSVSLIYNAFAISVSERSRYLGMLSSVGATKRQKQNSVFFEGAVIGAISIPLGIAAGYLGLGITYFFINPMLQGVLGIAQGFRLRAYPSSLLTAILVSGATILISVYIPARRASNVSAIDAIRQVSDVKISRRQVKTSALTRKLFGIEGDLGLKNLKRNKGRYKATVFSLIISMMLFLVVSSFTDYMKKSLILTQEGINFDIQTGIRAEDEKEEKDILNRMASLDDIDESVIFTSFTAYSWIDKASMADYLPKKEDGEFYQDGKYKYHIKINELDDTALKKYAKETGADYNRLIDTDNPSAIIIDSVRYRDQVTEKYGETKAVKLETGDRLELQLYNEEKDETVPLLTVKAAALTGTMPTGLMSLGKTDGFHIIVSEAVFHKMTEGKLELLKDAGLATYVYFNSSKPLRLQEKLEEIQSDFGGSSLSIYNYYQYKQREQQSILLVSVFTYAFIILITAICVANIINTISTSITLRKREFAMLKSIGITPKGFSRMLNYESIFYGVKALVYGIPISFMVMYLMYKTLMAKFEYDFTIPLVSVYIVIAAVFVIVGTAMLYSSHRVRRENIIDALKQEII